MALHAVSLKEVSDVQDTIRELQVEVSKNEAYRSLLGRQEGQYHEIKKYFEFQCGFLQYCSVVGPSRFYRVRRIEGCDFYNKKSEIIYPPVGLASSERMNNTSFRVLYVSLNEMTAMSEARLDSSCIGKRFQLTKFASRNDIKAYEIGDFSRAYLNLPRGSSEYRDFCEKYLGRYAGDGVVQGYSALESVLCGLLYSRDEYAYVLSSILADAIFSVNDRIDAILYPTQQNHFGKNVAFRKDSADRLEIEFTHVNELESVHPCGFYKYRTVMVCDDFSNPDSLSFEEEVGRNGGFF